MVAICSCAALSTLLKFCKKTKCRSVVASTSQSKQTRPQLPLSWTINSPPTCLMTGLRLAWCFQQTFPLLFAAPRTRSASCHFHPSSISFPPICTHFHQRLPHFHLSLHPLSSGPDPGHFQREVREAHLHSRECLLCIKRITSSIGA